MKITAVKSKKCDLGLLRPYSIAYKTVDSVSVSLVEIKLENGIYGLGSSNPSPYVVNESVEETVVTLVADDFEWLIGKDITTFQQLLYEVNTRYPKQPGVRAALDIALYDAFTKYLGVPLVTFLGQKMESLYTSITIGIKNVKETMEEAEEYIGRGFKILKVKLGKSIEEDIERLVKIREKYGASIITRIDANQGYDFEQISEFYERTKALDLELIEQPIAASDIAPMRKLPKHINALVAADESLVSPEDAFKLASPPAACGIFNIKLMKCGGVSKALEIATIAQNSNIALMWGCNDESIISITAALHAAFACPNTKYIDLDGSLDLAKDVVKGGFILENGKMSVNGKPGLGVSYITE
ncbi:MAG: dipeptide epimerase [Bacteroidota bacterium]